MFQLKEWTLRRVATGEAREELNGGENENVEECRAQANGLRRGGGGVALMA